MSRDTAGVTRLLGQLDAIEDGSGNGVLELPGGDRLEVSNLRKIFWPPRLRSGQATALTKGDLFRHYVRVAPYIYVDYLQNARGKTLASAYSARANEFAGVSTPLTWDEVDAGVSPKDFTMRTIAARLEAAGDLWAPLRKSKGADLRAVMKDVKERR